MGFLVYRSENIRWKIDPGPQVSLEASLLKENNTVGEQITVEQLIEKRKVMTISKEMIMHIGITSVSSRPKQFCIYYKVGGAP